MNHKTELLRSLWVSSRILTTKPERLKPGFQAPHGLSAPGSFRTYGDLHTDPKRQDPSYKDP